MALRIAPLGLAILLGACATRPGPLAPPPLMPWAQRAARLQALQGFTLSGRLAATNGREGFSAGLQWQQHGADATMELRGPLGLGAARVRQDAGQLRVTTDDGQTLEGAAAQGQLAQLLGFAPPLSSLRYWVLGVSDPTQGAQRSLDDEQRLATLQQGGWQIEYDEYTTVQQQWLPRRLTVTRDQLRLRLVINAWQL